MKFFSSLCVSKKFILSIDLTERTELLLKQRINPSRFYVGVDSASNFVSFVSLVR